MKRTPEQEEALPVACVVAVRATQSNAQALSVARSVIHVFVRDHEDALGAVNGLQDDLCWIFEQIEQAGDEVRDRMRDAGWVALA